MRKRVGVGILMLVLLADRPNQAEAGAFATGTTAQDDVTFVLVQRLSGLGVPVWAALAALGYVETTQAFDLTMLPRQKADGSPGLALDDNLPPLPRRSTRHARSRLR